MDESLNLEELRAQARAQLAGRMPPRTAWITGFEAALRQLLSPRAELFLAIMAAADNPGLDDERGGGTGNESGHPRGWIIGNLRTHVQDEWGTVREVRAKFLTLGPDCIGFQTADAGPDPFAASTAITRFAPRESAVEGGELREQSALAQVAVNLIDYGAMAEGTPEEAAAAYAAACDHRMLALLCAQELTFPDRDLREAVWDEHDSVMISRAEEARALARRRPMTVAEFARWLDGTLDDPGLVLPSVTGTDFARALALAALPPERRRRRDWRKRLVDDGEKGWQVGREQSTESETSAREISTYVRRDGTGFQEDSVYSWCSSTSVTEYDPDHVYEPRVYSGYFLSRQFYERDRGSGA